MNNIYDLNQYSYNNNEKQISGQEKVKINHEALLKEIENMDDFIDTVL